MKRLYLKSAALLPVLLIVTFLLVRNSPAEIYRWVDENGVTHFSDRKPTGVDTGKEQVVDPSGSGTLSVIEGGGTGTDYPSHAGEEMVNEPSQAINRNASVVIYTTDT